jgi:D-amino-acid dehydrogenase
VSKKIIIIGGGIIGLSSAYYLNKAGHQVTILDKALHQDGCSFGNAGMIVPSHFIPLAAPGMISKGIRWMFNSESPFYVKPRLNADLIKWGWQFYRHANEKHVQQSSIALKEIHLLSKRLYSEWAKELPFDFGYHERGLLMLYQTAAAEYEEKETAHIANKIGIEAHILTPQEVQKLEPDVKVNVRGAVYFPGDAHLTPQALVSQLKKYLIDRGVLFHHEEATQFEISNGQLKKVITQTQSLEADEFILAAGIWSDELSKQLNLSLPMQAGKGYSFTLSEVKNNTRIPSIFLEARVAVTPMGNSLRFGGTMEIAGINASINMNRVKGIADSISKYYPEMKVDLPQKENVWYGLRPCPPDGLPYIGRSKKIKNIIIATGHSMMGLSLGPATGKLVSEIINEGNTSVSIQEFEPSRFS